MEILKNETIPAFSAQLTQLMQQVNQADAQIKSIQEDSRIARLEKQELTQRLDRCSSDSSTSSDAVRRLQADLAKVEQSLDSPERNFCPHERKPQTKVGILGVKGQHDVLYAQDKLCSVDGKTCLLVHPTGNLIVYDTATYRVKWESGTYRGLCDVQLIMQSDGNLVLYEKHSDFAYWHSNTSGERILTFTDNGKLCVRTPNSHSCAWST
ncbi:uncharacterized protein LOC129590569 [Paramacrobiotus metropolitanus]|uniref:uncharacterized protein LOC129590569 n=1 Tax=Paramacrobiotus metropolitanus TaxID=2943436 RepID=UPI0024458AEB|nr:uncharacterized protein LOC129590569 [Paramacrobiotus metropolitanus]